MKSQLKDMLKEFVRGTGKLTVLTGAGISAESGIPTFRGPEGYWTIGSENYAPQEMATQAMFSRKPREVWEWYLYRLGICLQAQPNAGHLSLVEMERLLGERFQLITQNIDGLHLKAGSSLDQTFHIHGLISWVRCQAECSRTLYPLPPKAAEAAGKAIQEPLDEHLKCPRCGQWLRPHVLWFDECYDEGYFKLHSAMKAARQTRLLLVVGSSGATNLPQQIAQTVYENGGQIVEINLEDSAFTPLAYASGGLLLRQSSSVALPEILECLKNTNAF